MTRRSTLAVAVILTLTAGLYVPSDADAQGVRDRLRRTAERAAESEVQQAVERETRRVTRCALGDDRCVREAERAGNEVEIVDAAAKGGGAAPAAGTARRGGSDVDLGGDHPLVRPYTGSTLRERERQYSAYDEYDRIVGADARQVTLERLEGRVTLLVYDNPQGRSTLEIFRNYHQALTAQGLQVDFECQGGNACGLFALGSGRQAWPERGVARSRNNREDLRYFTGRMRHGEADAYVSIGVVTNRHFVHVLESVPMETGMVEVSAEVLAAGLEREGRVELQGIYFDTGSATLTRNSDAALEQVRQLLGTQPQLRLSVVGHTDNVGTAESNLQLSRDRAEAVRAALVTRFGIDASRLSAQGVGSAAPVASNDTESGRASNRRVELVRQ